MGDHTDGTVRDWLFTEFSFGDIHWMKLDIARAVTTGSVLDKVLRSPVTSAWLPLAALAAFLFLARPAGGARTLAILGPPLLCQALVYAAVCVFSSIDPLWQAQFFPRLVGALFPVLLLAAAPRFAFISSGADSSRVTTP